MRVTAVIVCSAHTFDVFVASCDVLGSGEADSLGADERSHPLRVFAVADHPALAHNDRVDISVHLGVDKGDVVKHVNLPILDGFDWGGAAAEHA